MTTAVEAIILAGGLGTRLRSVVSDLPKCMAPVNGKPFLHYVITHLQNQGVTDFIFSIGYMGDTIIDFIQKDFPDLSHRFSIESEPLGTGGAINYACEFATRPSCMVCNGDTLYKVDVSGLINYHEDVRADCTLALKPMHSFDRYGVVELNASNRIISFKEKQFYESGLINGGVYVLNREKFMNEDLPGKFSFEKDYLEKHVDKGNLYGLVQDEYFIDIGIPEDYQRVQGEL